MKKLPILLLLFVGLLIVCSSFSVKTDVVNYLNTSDTLVVNNVVYKLAWSSHPADNYYKQEYIPEGETLDKYNSMMLIDFLVTPDSTENLIAQKVAELKKRQEVDHFVDFQVLQNDASHGYLLDFVLSDIHNGSFDIMEWNGYSYSAFTDKHGHRGILLLGYSKRGYGKTIINFVKRLKINRIADINTLAAHGIPSIDLK